MNRRFYIKLFLVVYLSVSLPFTPFLTDPCYPLSIKLAESPDHPKGIEIPPDEELNKLEPVAQQPKSTPSPAPAKAPAASAPPSSSSGASSVSPSSSSASKPKKKKDGPKKEYSGIFALWEPLDKLIPLKNGTVSLHGVNMLRDEKWMVNASRYTGFANYYLEGGRDIAFIKDFNFKTQYNRQANDKVSSNELQSVAATLFKVNVRFDRTSKRTINDLTDKISTSITDTRKTTLSYKPSDLYSIDYIIEKKFNRSLKDSGNDTKYNNKQTIKIQYQPSKAFKINISHLLGANRNSKSIATTKNRLTDMKMTFKASDKLNLLAGYKATNNRSLKVAGETATRKTSYSSGFTYKYSSNLTLGMNYLFNNDRSQTAYLITGHDTTSREWNMKYKPLPWLNFQGKDKISSSETAGRTRLRDGKFSVDHKKIKLIPGATTIQIKEDVNDSGYGTNLKTTNKYTYSLSTPLKYLDNKLSLNYKYNVNEKLVSTRVLDKETSSTTNNYTANLKITKSVSIASALKVAEKSSLKGPDITSQSNTKTYTDKLTVKLKNPLTKRVGFAKNVSYVLSVTRNEGEKLMPSYSLTESQVIKNTGVLQIKGKTWNSKYSLERSVKKPTGKDMTRALSHKLSWNVKDLLNYKFTGNYALTLQQGDKSVSSALFSLSRQRGKNTLVSMLYKFNKNQDPAKRASNKYKKYFEAGIEFKF